MTNTYDISIIGGGIMGLLTAKELVEAGCKVTIFDQSNFGTESSWAGGGILLPLYPWRQAPEINPLVLESIKHYKSLANELFNATQIDSEWTDCGLLICKNQNNDNSIAWCNNHNIPHKKASADFFDNLNTKTQSPLWLPTVAHIRNPRLLKSLKVYLHKHKVKFIENCEILSCKVKNKIINKLDTRQGEFNIDQLIICTGAWSGQLLKKLLPTSFSPKIYPVKGQMLMFIAKPNTLAHIVLDNDCYLIPRNDGKILVGSTVEYCNFDKSTSRAAYNKLYAFATNLVPALKNHKVYRHWAGLRPGSQYGIPCVGYHPEIKNLKVNAGHFRNGLVMAPACAKLIADLTLDRKPCVNPNPYRLKPANT